MTKSDTNNRAGRSGSNLTIIPGLGLADLASSGLPDSLAGKVSTELEVSAERMHQGLLAAAVAVGLEVFDELLQAEVTQVAGPKGRHNLDRRAVRHGTEAAKVPMGGRLVGVAKPRVRAVDGSGEIGLETWAALADRELLAEHTLVSMLAGVSTRSYETVQEPMGSVVAERSSSTSRSAVSRRARQRIRELTARALIAAPTDAVIARLNRFLAGWAGYFRHGNSARSFDKLQAHAKLRVAIFLGIKHQRGRWWGQRVVYSNPTELGIYRLVGTVKAPRWASPGIVEGF